MTRMPKPLDVATRRRLRARRATEPPAGADRRATAIAALVLGAQVLVLLVAEALRPEAAAVPPHAFWDTLATVLSFAYLGSLFAAAFTLERPRLSVRASSYAAGGALVFTLGCPASGHHTMGAWFGTELALVGLGIAAAVAGRRLLR